MFDLKEYCKKYRQKNKERIKEYNRKYRKENPEKVKKWDKKWYQEHREEKKEYCKKLYQKNSDKIKEKANERTKKYYQENKDKVKKYQKEYRKDNIKKVKEYQKEYCQKNKEVLGEYRNKWQRERGQKFPKFRLDKIMSCSIRLALKGKKAGRVWESLVGYTVEDLIQYLENQFDNKMTWENYGYWEIDHIKPKSLFKYKTVEDIEFKKCWALANLQPLEATANRKKFNHYVEKRKDIRKFRKEF